MKVVVNGKPTRVKRSPRSKGKTVTKKERVPRTPKDWYLVTVVRARSLRVYAETPEAAKEKATIRVSRSKVIWAIEDVQLMPDGFPRRARKQKNAAQKTAKTETVEGAKTA